MKLVLEKLSALEEVHKKCELEKTSLRNEIMKKDGAGDEGYKTMEFTVGKDGKEQMEYQLREVR